MQGPLIVALLLEDRSNIMPHPGTKVETKDRGLIGEEEEDREGRAEGAVEETSAMCVVLWAIGPEIVQIPSHRARITGHLRGDGVLKEVVPVVMSEVHTPQTTRGNTFHHPPIHKHP